MSMITNFETTLFNFFSRHIPNYGKCSGFIKRRSKLSASAFVKALIGSCLSGRRMTLAGLGGYLAEQQIRITKQSLFERFNERGVSLLKSLVELSLNELTGQLPGLNTKLAFSSVYIIDSSTISLPSTLQEHFRGCGGNASVAAAKLQVLYEQLRGEIHALTLTPGHHNDQGFEDYFTNIKKKALYLMDLGYFKLATLQRIVAAKAYFVTRYLPGTLLLTLDKKPLNLLELLPKTANDFHAQEVLLGHKAQLKVRLVAQCLPKKVVNERVRKLRKSYQRRGLTLSARRKKLAQWTIFLTNLPLTHYQPTQVIELYRLRWQIELLFKLAKSGLQLTIHPSHKTPRVLIELYAKLLCLILLLAFCNYSQAKSNRPISCLKAYNYFACFALQFTQTLASPKKLALFIDKFSDLLVFYASKETNKRSCQFLSPDSFLPLT